LAPMDMALGMWILMGVMMVIMMGGMAFAGVRTWWRRRRGQNDGERQ
jgi:hypothetical protein